MTKDELLASTRVGILITAGAPIGVPVWFDWDGECVRMFSARDAAKVKRLTRHPKASLLVTNQVGESEGWVAFDGNVEISTQGAIELADKLAARYWDLTQPGPRATLDAWLQAPDAFALLTLRPRRVREGR